MQICINKYIFLAILGFILAELPLGALAIFDDSGDGFEFWIGIHGLVFFIGGIMAMIAGIVQYIEHRKSNQ